EVLYDTVQIFGSCFLGLTMQCARCHSHKYEPIPQEDYYRLMAIFTPAFNPQAWKRPQERPVPDVSAREQAEIERHNANLDRQVVKVKQQIADLCRPHEERLRQQKLASLPEAIRADTQAAVAATPEKRTTVQKYLAGKFEKLLQVQPEEVNSALSPSERSAIARMQEEIATLNGQRPSFEIIQAIYDVGPPPAAHLLKLGSFGHRGKEVPPGFLRVLSPPEVSRWMPAAKPGATTSGRRTALARWLTDPQSPASALFARVTVNRIWQHLMGRGIVPTPDNFGLTGTPPTHPELLEWLASEFVRSGWRVKPLVKLIMMSSAYRQSAGREAQRAERGALAEQTDPENHLLWRMRLRRLEAECI